MNGNTHDINHNERYVSHRRPHSLGVDRQVESTAVTLCLLACLLLSFTTPAARASAFTFDDIQFWVGTGTNRSALVVDWFEDSAEPAALAWGYRWDGTATGRDMLLAVVEADQRLFAKLGNTPANPVRVYGFGYDADNDGEFGACSDYDCTTFDESGLAYSGEIYVAATATDAGDLYREGWAYGTGFWHYGNSATPGTNPFDGGAWADTQIGMASRTLVDGDWDSWAFQRSTIPPFDSYAEDPQAAAPPWTLPGDYDADGDVDPDDYARWRLAYGTSDLAADGNDDGVVDAADYTVWRDHLGTATGNSTITAERAVSASPTAIPEPATALLLLSAWLAWPFNPRHFKRRLRRGSQRICVHDRPPLSTVCDNLRNLRLTSCLPSTSLRTRPCARTPQEMSQ